MDEAISNNFRARFLSVLNSLMNLMNRTSKAPNEKPEKKKTKQAAFKEMKDDKGKIKDKNYSYKGSAYQGKGKITRDAATFNHPRKDVPRGRQH